jgi:hypothetical protein
LGHFTFKSEWDTHTYSVLNTITGNFETRESRDVYVPYPYPKYENIRYNISKILYNRDGLHFFGYSKSQDDYYTLTLSHHLNVHSKVDDCSRFYKLDIIL